MKQAFNAKNGVICREIPEPFCDKKEILVDVRFSCISAGTEVSSVRNNQKSLFKRALENPSKMFPFAMDVLKSRGAKALLMVANGATGGNFGKPLGYTAAGIVRLVGEGCEGFSTGDRVAIVGAGYANHASVDSVPQNLATHVPQNVSFEEASTCAVGCIAMQGVRRLEVVPGETIVVMGLGILGMLGFQMLKTLGCTVIGVDINESRLRRARKLGCDFVLNGSDKNMLKRVFAITDSRGADGVLFTAATNSSKPMSECFQMLRRKGRLVLVGVSGMNIRREDIYNKELDFRMATSYGAGRYDQSYEIEGKDYPVEWVRWTEKRNMQAYLDMLARHQLDVLSLVDAVYDIETVGAAYEALNKTMRPLIVLLKYPKQHVEEQKRWDLPKEVVRKRLPSSIRYAIIGAGSFVRSMHLPNLEKMRNKFHLEAVMSRTGSNAAFLAHLYGARYYTTEIDEILNDSSIEMVMICTRHDLHAEYAIRALEKGKAVFVEKPASISHDELDKLMKTIKKTGKPYFVGYNRRFSDYAKEIRRVLHNRKQPLRILYTMNAGYIPEDYWVHGNSGGGRIVGEGCHIVDMISSIVQSPIKDISVSALRDNGGYYSCQDNVSTTFTYEDGSVAVMLYFSSGSKQYPKENMNIWLGDKHILLKDYTELTAEGLSVKHIRTSTPAKGHQQELLAFYEAITKGNGYPISVDEIEQTTLATLTIRDQVVSAAGKTNQ